MDSSHLRSYTVAVDKPPGRNILMAPLAASLWGRDSLSRRSDDLSPIYIRRYIGPRNLCRPDRHSFWDMTYVFRGTGELQCRQRYSLGTHTLFLIPPGTDHYEYAPLPMDTLWIGLQGRRLTELDPSVVRIGPIPELKAVFEQLWWMTERYRQRIGPELDALTALAVHEFIRLLSEKQDSGLRGINEAIQWMHNHFDQPLSVPGLAEQFGCSEGYFYRIFKKQTGKAPVAYLTDIRMQHAMDAIQNTTMTIDKIARLVGYRDPLYFSRIFRKTVGRSPSSIRLIHESQRQ